MSNILLDTWYKKSFTKLRKCSNVVLCLASQLLKWGLHTILAHEKIRGRLRIQESETWKVKISWWGEKRRMKRKSIYSTTLTLWVTSPFRFSGLLSYLLFIIPPNFRICVQWKVPANTLCHICIQWETKVCKKPKLPSLFFILRQCFSPNECPGLYWNIDSRD